MKKLFLLCLGFFPCVVLAASNKISMVTYFPVPYVAYSQVKAGQMDIGLTTTNTCDMKLGCDTATTPLCETATTPLNVTDKVNLKQGSLNLDGGLGIVGSKLTLGIGSGEGNIKFENVRIQSGNMESVNAEYMNVTTLNLFRKAFPSCKTANPQSNGNMSWKSLKLVGANSDELYLVCGDAETASTSGDCSLSSYKLGHKSECCPSAPYTDTTCWKAVPTTAKWEWGFRQ